MNGNIYSEVLSSCGINKSMKNENCLPGGAPPSPLLLYHYQYMTILLLTSAISYICELCPTHTHPQVGAYIAYLLVSQGCSMFMDVNAILLRH